MGVSILWYLMLIRIAIGSLSSSDSSSGGGDGDGDKFEGTFRATLAGFPVKVSVCKRDGTYYLASKRCLSTFEPANYINMVGRSTHVSDGKIIFGETFRFKEAEIGAEQMSVTLRFNSGEYTLSNGATTVLERIYGWAEVCLAPQRDWTTVETPFLAESKDLTQLCPPSHSHCVEIQRFENTEEVNGACWAFYDIGTGLPFTGGDLSVNVEIEWGNGLRILEWSDIGFGAPEGCSVGSEMQVWISQDSFLKTVKCVDTSAGGGSYEQFTQCAVLCGGLKEDTCPLYPQALPAKLESMANILENEQNNIENDNTNHNEEVVIKLSTATILNLWAILIVFILFTTIMCWCQNRKKKEQHFDLKSTV